ncbi:MAG: substrate-binding domain-containing protein [Nevskia sp.]|nr:substrate-binding domain-containing protein [Nevskia sp.]
MKKHLIAAAVASMGLAATSAYALPPTTTPDYIIYVGSGSAQANAHYWAATQLLSNVDSYTDSSTCAESGTYRILFGTTKAAYNDGKGTTIPSGKNVLYMVRFGGGTFPNSIAAVANAAALVYPASLTGSTACGGAPHATYQLPSGFATTTQIPDFGTSDEEVALFNNSLNVVGSYSAGPGGTQIFHPGTTLAASAVANLSQVPLYENILGMAVTNVVYNGTTSFPHPKTNFTKPELAAILSGSITNWNQLFADDGTVMPNQAMILEDRTPGSGTKAGITQALLLSPTSPNGGLTPYNENLTGGGPVGTRPSSACSSSNPSAFTDLNNGSNTVVFQGLQADNTNGCLAIGILGAEFPPEVQGGGYQLVKINGADPYSRITSGGHVYATYANEINGTYDIFVSNSFNYRTKSINGGGYLGDHTAHSVFINIFMSELGNGNLPGGVSGQFPLGVTGTLLDPSVSNFGDCVTTGTHFGNSLAPLQLFADATFGAAPACNDQLQ